MREGASPRRAAGSGRPPALRCPALPEERRQHRGVTRWGEEKRRKRNQIAERIRKGGGEAKPSPPHPPAHTCEAFQSYPSASVAPAGERGGAAAPKRARQTAREIRGSGAAGSGPGRRTLPRPLPAPAGDCTSRLRYFIYNSFLKFSLLLSLSRGRTGFVALRAGVLPGRLPWACEVGREGRRDAFD